MTQDVNARSRPAQLLVRLLVATFALLATTPAAAQTLYRCGNTYQDRPCSGADAGRVVGRGDPRADGNPRTALHTDCAQRGEAALRIMWLRQAGAQQDQVRELSDRNAPAPDAELIAQVYRLRGSPPDWLRVEPTHPANSTGPFLLSAVWLMPKGCLYEGHVARLSAVAFRRPIRSL